MSILGKIMGAIFGSPASAAPAGTPAPGTPGAAPTATAGSTPGAAQSTAAAGSATTAAPAGSVDVEAILEKAAKSKGQPLNWRTSIVDLMKALDLDSSLTARKELAHDLNYTGDTNDSATMNVWLHKQVMAKVAANGGKVPADLQS